MPILELLAVSLERPCLAFAFFLLGGEVLHQQTDDFAPVAPQRAQVIENQGRQAGVGPFEPLLQRLEHFLHAASGRLLLLEAIAQALHFRAQLFMLLAQLGAAAEQLDDAPVLGRRFRGIGAAEKTESLQRFHKPLRGGRLDVSYVRNPWPRSMQYSSHLFNIVFRAQR